MPRPYKAIAEYYDAENEHHAMLAEDVPFLLGAMPRRRRDVLELAVGTARAAIPLAQAGHRVVGVDYDEAMLALARRKRDAVGLGERQLSLAHGDCLSLDLGRRFDWVVLLFNTFLAFTTLEEQDAVLASVRRHLRPRGTFWLDVFQPNLALLAKPESRGLDPHVFHVPALDRTVFKATDVRRDVTAQTQEVTFRYEWFDAHGVPRRRRTRFTIVSVFPRELRLLLDRHGLHVDALYGNYDGSPLASDSPRMIARCSPARRGAAGRA